jgi:hypothetical protein
LATTAYDGREMKSQLWGNESPEWGIEAMVAMINDEEKLIEAIKEEIWKRKAVMSSDSPSSI